MLSRADLWEQFKPKLEEARRLDRLEGTLVFLAQPVKVGRFKVAPVTLERLLWLEALESPFLGGGDVPGRLDTLKALWVLSPHFRPGNIWAGRLFCAANICLDWKWYAMTVAKLFEEGMALMSSSWDDPHKQPTDTDPLWAASMIDGFASQYGWPMATIMRLPLLQVAKLGEALGARIAATAGSKVPRNSGRHSDRVKNDYLDASKKVDEAHMAAGLN